MNFERGATKIVRDLSEEWIHNNLPDISGQIECGLPEYDDRLKVWRVTIKPIQSTATLGEIQVDQGMNKVVNCTDRSLVLERFEKESQKNVIVKASLKDCFSLRRFPIK